MIDDYAHHPEELRALITGARSLFSDYGLLLIFQPHLYSRTRDQVTGFGESLDLADSVILLPIYPARELPIEGVSSAMILERMTIKEKRLMEKTALLEGLKDYIEEQKRETKKDKWVVITAGAGDIDAMLPQLKEKLLHG
jgi:UDP-N-acetylmuramate--alanine ligase